MPRTVWISFGWKGSSTLARNRRTITSTTLVLVAKVDVPDLGCDFRAGDDLAGGTDEMRQEEKFLRG